MFSLIFAFSSPTTSLAYITSNKDLLNILKVNISRLTKWIKREQHFWLEKKLWFSFSSFIILNFNFQDKKNWVAPDIVIIMGLWHWVSYKYLSDFSLVLTSFILENTCLSFNSYHVINNNFVWLFRHFFPYNFQLRNLDCMLWGSHNRLKYKYWAFLNNPFTVSQLSVIILQTLNHSLIVILLTFCVILLVSACTWILLHSFWSLLSFFVTPVLAMFLSVCSFWTL
jgi:hypothetical protein